MKTDFPFLTLGSTALALLALAACSGTTASTTSQASTLLSSAQCTFLADRAAAEACEQAFRTCSTQAGADLAACRATLEACLPAPPDGGVAMPMGDHDPRRGGEHFEGSDLDGGHGRGGPGCDGANGGFSPGGDIRGDHGGSIAVQPDAAATTACHDALSTCLAASPKDLTCFTTERSCEQATFASAFAAACQAVLPCTATDPACTELQHRCQEGVDGRPGAFDGGTCP